MSLIPGSTLTMAQAGARAAPPPVGTYVWDGTSAQQIPAVARCLQLYGGMCKQMPMDAFRGSTPLPRPNLLKRPDPNRARSWFVDVSVNDYLLNGNAIALVTSRGVDGWPTAVTWLPASWVYIQWLPWAETSVNYYYIGQLLPPEDVIHVRRGADRFYPVRGVGVIEQNLTTLDRVVMESEYERSALAGAAVPSVAIIAPGVITQDVADQAKADWVTKYGGPVREPAILPNGTQVVPLSWSPTDAQLSEARKQSLTDVANMFNIDGYWLGAPVAGMTYRTAGPQYMQILRTSLEPVLADFEDVWSDAWLPRGQMIRFDRNQLLRDDLATTTTALVALTGASIMSTDEARQYLELSPAGTDASGVTAGTIGGPNPAQPVEIAGGGGPPP